MESNQFIESIAKYVAKFAPKYGIEVYSPIIAQAILESASGTSELAVNANNFFGLKWREGRMCDCVETYNKVGSEQNPDGSYVSSQMVWCKFPSMACGVKGYFDFTNIANYKSLKGVTDPYTYLQNIKAAGYATSINYVDNVYAVIERYGLKKYDPNYVPETDDAKDDIAPEVPGSEVEDSGTSDSESILYRVRKSWDDAASQIGTYSIYENAKKVADENPGYFVFDGVGNIVYPSVSIPSEKDPDSSEEVPPIQPGTTGGADGEHSSGTGSGDQTGTAEAPENEPSGADQVPPETDSEAAQDKKRLVINIHAGHSMKGGGSVGAIGLIEESVENRVIKDKVMNLLRSAGHVVYDCSQDTGNNNQVLEGIVNKCKQHAVDVDISIHFNAFTNRYVKDGETTGVEAYVYSADCKRYDTAKQIVSNIAELGYRNRGVKVRNTLYYLKNIREGILLEVCFVDDGDDVELYCSKRDEIAKSIVDGIVSTVSPEVSIDSQIGTPIDIPISIPTNFLVKVTIPNLRIRKEPSVTSPIVTYNNSEYIAPGIYTIVEVQGSWGKLKSGLGWISLEYATKL